MLKGNVFKHSGCTQPHGVTDNGKIGLTNRWKSKAGSVAVPGGSSVGGWMGAYMDVWVAQKVLKQRLFFSRNLQSPGVGDNWRQFGANLHVYLFLGSPSS